MDSTSPVLFPAVTVTHAGCVEPFVIVVWLYKKRTNSINILEEQKGTKPGLITPSVPVEEKRYITNISENNSF